jgi:hypothetical protein
MDSHASSLDHMCVAPHDEARQLRFGERQMRKAHQVYDKTSRNFFVGVRAANYNH